MGRLFNMDNPFFRIMSRFADLVILNIVFLICCIPIVTIGPALCGMYYTLTRVANKEDPYIVKNFFKSFKLNLKQGILIWLVYLVVGLVLLLDYRIISISNLGLLSDVMRIMLIAMSFLYLITLCYVFAVLSRFYNSIRDTLKNALLMSIRHFPFTLLIALLPIAALIITLLNGYTFVYGLLFWMVVGFALIAFLQSMLFIRIFKIYMPEEEEISDEFHVSTPEAPAMTGNIPSFVSPANAPQKKEEEDPWAELLGPSDQ